MNIIDKIAEKIIRKLLPGAAALIEQNAINNLADQIDARFADVYGDYYDLRDLFAGINGMRVARVRINNTFHVITDDPLNYVPIERKHAERAIMIGILQPCQNASDRCDQYQVDLDFYFP